MNNLGSMPLVFWQPCLSIHQTPLLEQVARDWDAPIYLVVDRETPRGRTQSSGWKVTKPAGMTVTTDGATAPRNAIHVVSGFWGPEQWRRFRREILRDKGSQIWVAAESLEIRDNLIKVPLRFFRHGMARARLGRKLVGFLGIGHSARKQARIFLVPSQRIYPFCYVTRSEENNFAVSGETGSKNRKVVLFVGQISKRKGVDFLFNMNLSSETKLRIIGSHVDSSVTIPPDVEYLGIVPNEFIPSELRKADVLVLPSRYDGWGAVVNEALAVGTAVVCTEACGAADLLRTQKPYRGEIVKDLTPSRIAEAVQKVLTSEVRRDEIRTWSSDTISPRSVSRYLIEVLEGKEASPPWGAL